MKKNLVRILKKKNALRFIAATKKSLSTFDRQGPV